MYDAVELAKYIVSKCIKDEHPRSNLQLQKILYYIQKRFVDEGTRAFSDEIEAWRFGPVVPNVYYFFCGSGSMPIILPYQGEAPEANDKAKIDDIISEKRDINPWDMVRDTHKVGGAWYKTYNDGLGNKNVISISLIKECG